MAVNATAIWRVRPSGVNTNGGGYDPGIGGAATDYSQQNAAQATGTNGAGSATTTFTDATAAAFTSAMVGNCINITGQGFYFVTAFTSATQVVVDRALGTFSAATWHLGGGWADPVTNLGSSSPVVAGNIIYILGSGTPNPSSYVYDYAVSGIGPTPSGSTTAGFITLANDPLTPGYKTPPDTTGGMPTIQLTNGTFLSAANQFMLVGLWFVEAGSGGTVLASSYNGSTIYACVLDQFGNTGSGLCGGGLNGNVIGSECYSSAGGSGGGIYAINIGPGCVQDCNIHDCAGPGITATDCSISNNIIAKNSGDGIILNSSQGHVCTVFNNTIDGNTGHGIEVQTQTCLVALSAFNNIISNQTGVGKAGLIIDAGTAAANSRAQCFVDYNTFYNNTANYSAINASPHDTALGISPYVAQSTENYTLA